MKCHETLQAADARRLALSRAGLLKPEWTNFPVKAGKGPSAQRRACHRVIQRFGYLQLDTISVAGARSHALVLLSRLPGLDPKLPESLLTLGASIFEYWAHEASWIPLELYPAFGFRRREYRRHDPWWGTVVADHRRQARAILKRIRDEGPLRSKDFRDDSPRNDWGANLTRQLLRCLWTGGQLAIRERRQFHRHFDLTERVIPAALRKSELPEQEAITTLLLKALEGHGWAETRTLAETWRLKKRRKQIDACLRELERRGEILSCAVVTAQGRSPAGWVRPKDLDLLARLKRVRPRPDHGVLLSPFDPILWDRERAKALFDFDPILEVFKPAHKRRYGYYCMPVLAGDRLVGRCDLRADRKKGRLHVAAKHHEPGAGSTHRQALRHALERYATALSLRL
jgi:uncharacterized protein YcaQ